MKLNLGCGHIVVDGWINVEGSKKVYLARIPVVADLLHRFGVLSDHDHYRIQQWDSSVVHHDVTKGLPYDAETADYIYSSHMLEHLSRDEARDVCDECRRLLKPGGVFRVVVPDLKEMAERYLASDVDFFENQSGPPADRFMSRNMFQNHHKWAYDAESLTYLLEEAGFNSEAITQCDYRSGECPDLDQIETHEPPKSVYIEAKKTGGK